MSDVKALQNEKKLGQETLFPQNVRIFGKFSYVMAWTGGCIAIGAFMSGASIVPPAGQLNLFQAFMAMLVGLTICAIALTLNSRPGHKYGIPFIVQARSAFGLKGTIVPGFIRAVPAVFWYGVQSWIGASAINTISAKLFGFENIVLYFIIFQVIQIVLSSLGFKGIKWLENIGAICILLALSYMFYIIYTTYSAEVSANLIHIEGTWGLAFWGGTIAFLGTYTTLILNVSDIARELNKSVKPGTVGLLHWLGIFPATTFMGLIGLLAAGATGTWDPIQLFVEAIPNTGILIITLLFIAIAQITTNVLNNVVPPVYVMMDIFKLSYRKCAIIIGIIAMCTFPWRIASEGFFLLFIQLYSAFLGPIFAVMVVDYFIIRKRNLHMEMFYDENGPFKGINWQGIIAIVIGAIFALVEVQLSWYSSLIPAGLSYYLLMKYYPISKSFLSGTIFDKNKSAANAQQNICS